MESSESGQRYNPGAEDKAQHNHVDDRWHDAHLLWFWIAKARKQVVGRGAFSFMTNSVTYM